jgi:hypothetical protein
MLDRNSHPSSWLLLLAVALCLVPAPHRPWLAHAAIAAENTGDMLEGGGITKEVTFLSIDVLYVHVISHVPPVPRPGNM